MLVFKILPRPPAGSRSLPNRQHIRRGVAEKALIAKSEGSSDHTSSQLLRFSASHVSGANNPRADAGSRFTANPSLETRFASLTSGWSPTSTKTDQHLATYLHTHSVADSTFIQYERALNK
ncbi:hypothetical protein PHMEG_00026191 [Phytophthora megakarya]|uniref:Uncharacterized protein n=1 Tax=Phytophthora megakarya TaxID=4795 RepID=A0A225VA68_9STRA|nr:hypothetical protein PHMEG_00026191 [Phytophthora megakarya]